MVRRGTILVLLLAVMAVVPSLAEGFVYVSLSGDNSDGASWATAYQGIAIAVTHAIETGQDIYVAEGTYQLRAKLDIPAAISLYGGFPATGDPGPEDRDPRAHATIIDAHGTQTHLLNYTTTGGAVVDGFTFTNAKGGAWVYMNQVPVTVRNCMFVGNRGGYSCVTLYRAIGGEVMNCFFKNNEATNGAGIGAYDSVFGVDSCIFLDNYVTNTGGAIESHEGAFAAVVNCVFAGNRAGLHGGGVRFDFTDHVYIVNCTFHDNQCDREQGGALVLLRSGGYVMNSIFSRNTKYALCFVDHALRPPVTNCLFYDNPWGAYKNDVAGIVADGAGLNELPECSVNIDGDPLFRDTAIDDYYVQPESPVIDAGAGSPWGAVSPIPPPFDLAGRARPYDYEGNGEQQYSCDIGAYEFYPGAGGVFYESHKPIVYVSPCGDNSDGLTWATAFTAVATAAEQALARAADIYVAAGTYPVGGRLNMDLSVSWYGGFPAEGNPGFGDRNPDDYETVLDGQGISSELIKYDTTTGIEFDGITVRNRAGGAAALYFRNTSAAINDCLFAGNTGGLDGGAIHAFTCTNLDVSRCMFMDNAGRYGAGIGAYETHLAVDRCAFLYNTAVTEVGGGVESHEGNATVVTNSIFAHNFAYMHGGAVRCYWTGEAIVSNCTIVDNSCQTEYGGGIALMRSGGLVSNCILAGNNRYAVWFFDHDPRPSIYNTLFYNNDGVYKNDAVGEIETVDGPLGLNVLLPEVAENLEGDPLFMNSEWENYHLSADSICIDAGTPAGAPLWDYDGAIRPIAQSVEGAFDIGAYEFTGEELTFGLIDVAEGEGEEGEGEGEEGEGEGEEGEGEGEEGEGEGEEGEGEGEEGEGEEGEGEGEEGEGEGEEGEGEGEEGEGEGEEGEGEGEEGEGEGEEGEGEVSEGEGEEGDDEEHGGCFGGR